MEPLTKDKMRRLGRLARKIQDMGILLDITNTKCNNPECSVSTGLMEELTFGHGELNKNGYWQFPCEKCARAAEKIDGVKENTYWPPKG